LTDEGYAPTFKSLMDDTEWEKYGVGRNPACDNCMAHCGFEGTAVDDAFSHPLKLLTTTILGARVTGPMAPDLPILYSDGDRRPRAGAAVATVAVADVKRSTRAPEGGHPSRPQ
jgi:hypothetical protein